jgi:hypothetical protein
MQRFGIRDSGSPLGKEVTSLPTLPMTHGSFTHGSFLTFSARLPDAWSSQDGGHTGWPFLCRSRLESDGRRMRGFRAPDARKLCLRLPSDPDTTKRRFDTHKKVQLGVYAHKS